MSTKSSEFLQAIEVFARAIAFTRCFTYPSVADRVGSLWVIRDEKRKRAADYRREEWTATDEAPVAVDHAARSGTRGRFCLCVIVPNENDDEPLKAAYKSLGYRYHCAEAFMQHRLAKIGNVRARFEIKRINTPELAERIAKAAGRRQILPEHLATDKPLRLYAAFDGDKPVGWLRSIAAGKSNWVSNVYTQPAYRRQGVGTSLLTKMLRDDKKFGAKTSVLTATKAGALLYERVGFEHLGRLLMFTPKR
jgi:GNAT superfamily N-acetyltransferase